MENLRGGGEEEWKLVRADDFVIPPPSPTIIDSGRKIFPRIANGKIR